MITFGRDFDTKYVIADNWGEFLLSFANDLEAGNWFLVDDNDDFFAGDGELVYRDKKRNGPPQDYFDVLKSRAIEKYKNFTQQTKPSTKEKVPNSNPSVVNSDIHDTESFELEDDDEEITSTHKIELINTEPQDINVDVEKKLPELPAENNVATEDITTVDSTEPEVPEQETATPVEESNNEINEEKEEEEKGLPNAETDNETNMEEVEVEKVQEDFENVAL